MELEIGDAAGWPEVYGLLKGVGGVPSLQVSVTRNPNPNQAAGRVPVTRTKIDVGGRGVGEHRRPTKGHAGLDSGRKRGRRRKRCRHRLDMARALLAEHVGAVAVGVRDVEAATADGGIPKATQSVTWRSTASARSGVVTEVDPPVPPTEPSTVTGVAST